jgi:FkbM family methyltransferase
VQFTIDDRLRLIASDDAADAVDYHFVRDGDSCDEMAAFIAVSAAAAPDALLFDVGAHIGLFSVVHMALSPAHRAVLFEPSTPLSVKARAWLEQNAMTDRGDVRCAGAGSRVETRMIETDALEFARDAREPASGSPVPFTTIDQVCRTGGLRPDILKIDVEGQEGEVIEGAVETLRDARPIVCLELHLDVLERQGRALEAILGAFAAAGYRLFDAGGRRLSAAKVRRSLKAILRVTARPSERT